MGRGAWDEGRGARGEGRGTEGERLANAAELAAFELDAQAGQLAAEFLLVVIHGCPGLTAEACEEACIARGPLHFDE